MKPTLALIFLGLLFMLSSCATAPLEEAEPKTPSLHFDEYFNGPVKAWGVVQNRGGKVVRRFEVAMLGTWQGNKGTLDEQFDYYDGKKQHRVWHITKLPDGSFEGRADDIFGKATSQNNGGSIKWSYDMSLDVGNSKYRVTFDDRMFLMRDGIVINHSVLKKFGFKVADLIIFMKKDNGYNIKK